MSDGLLVVDFAVDGRARQHASRALHVYQDDDGMVTVRGRLAPEVGALLVQALAAARAALYQKADENVPAGTSTTETPTMETPPMARRPDGQPLPEVPPPARCPTIP